MKYLCEICGESFDSEIACKHHTEEHSISDLYGKWFRINDYEIYKPVGYVVLSDGFLMSGVCVTLNEDHIGFSMSHFPPEVLAEKTIVTEDEIGKSVRQSIAKISTKCMTEMYIKLIERNKQKNEGE